MKVWFTLLTIGDVVWFGVALMMFVASVVLFRRRHAVATVFLLIGSSAYLAKHIFWNFVAFMMPHALDHPDSPLAKLLYPTDASAPWTDQLVKALLLVTVLFPLGLLLYCITAVRKHLTNQSN